jgi:hypothetical protein
LSSSFSLHEIKLKAGDRKIDLGFKNIESITIVVRTETDRLCFTGVYNPPSMKHDVFKTDFSNTCENLLSRYDNLFILGDLNYDRLDKYKKTKSICFSSYFNSYGFNIFKTEVYFPITC